MFSCLHLKHMHLQHYHFQANQWHWTRLGGLLDWTGARFSHRIETCHAFMTSQWEHVKATMTWWMMCHFLRHTVTLRSSRRCCPPAPMQFACLWRVPTSPESPRLTERRSGYLKFFATCTNLTKSYRKYTYSKWSILELAICICVETHCFLL